MLYLANLLYIPVSGDLKSGIPAETLIPAPVKNTIFLAVLSLRSFTNLSRVYFYSFFSFSTYFSFFYSFSSFSFPSFILNFGYSFLSLSIFKFLSKASVSSSKATLSFPSGNFMLENFICNIVRGVEVMQLSQSQHQIDPSVKLKATSCLVCALCSDICPLTYLEQKTPLQTKHIQFSYLLVQSLHTPGRIKLLSVSKSL